MSNTTSTYIIENLEQLRALSDSLRIHILEALTRQALTVTQLGDRLGEAPAKMLYHVRELERVGLVRLVEKREKGGNLEKYYRAVAESIQISPALLRSAPLDETLGQIQQWMSVVMSESLDALARSRAGAGDPMRLTTEVLWLSPDEVPAFTKRLDALLEEYGKPRGKEGEGEWHFNILMYRARDGSAEHKEQGGASKEENQ